MDVLGAFGRAHRRLARPRLDRPGERAPSGGGPHTLSSAPWRAAGLDVGLIYDALEHGLEPAEAGEWWRAGFSPQAAAQLDFCGFDLAEARTLRAELGKVDAVLSHALAVAAS